MTLRPVGNGVAVVGTTARQLPSFPCTLAILQGWPGNTSTLAVGAFVTTANLTIPAGGAAALTDGVILPAGEFLPIRLTNLSQLQAKAGAASQAISYLVFDGDDNTERPIYSGASLIGTSVSVLPNVAGSLVYFRTLAANTGNIAVAPYYGVADVTLPTGSADNTTDGLVLTPGADLFLPGNMLSSFQVKASAASQVLTYLVMG